MVYFAPPPKKNTIKEFFTPIPLDLNESCQSLGPENYTSLGILQTKLSRDLYAVNLLI